MRRKASDDATSEISFSFATMSDLIYVLMDVIPDRQIVDETGLKGEYDFTLALRSDLLRDGEDLGDLSASLLRSFSPTGLKVEHKKAPIRTLVIDQAEIPAGG